jgi:hypothetical protein
MTREVTHQYAELLVDAAHAASVSLGFEGVHGFDEVVDTNGSNVTQTGGRVGAA